jgi:hypothetical protein
MEVLVGSLATIFAYYSIVYIVNFYNLYQHPFNMMIRPLITPWLQSLSWGKRAGITQKNYALCINLSGHLIETALVPNLKHAFNFKHKDCELRGFYQEYGALMVEVSHPNHDMIAIHQLWQELRKAGINFKHCNLLLSPKQVDQFEQNIQQEWPLLIPIINKASQLNIIIYEKKLHHHLYYACEYNACAVPWFDYDAMAPLSVSRHHLSISYDQMLQSLFKHINELCVISPVEDGTRKEIFLLPKKLSALKLKCLNVLECCQKLGLNINGLGLTLFHVTPPNIQHSRWNIYQKLQQTVIILGFILIWQYLSYNHNISSMNNTLEKHTDQEVITHILEYDTVAYPKLKKHIQRNKDFYFQNLTPELQILTDWLILQHRTSPLPEEITDAISNLTQISKENHYDILSLWSIVAPVNSTPDIEQLAAQFPYLELMQVCRAYPNATDCKSSVQDAISQHQLEYKLDRIYNTLLPLDLQDANYNIRQIRYLRANPKEIAKNISQNLEDIFSQHAEHKDLPRYKKKVQHIKSITSLLNSPQGHAILQVLEDFYTHMNKINSPQSALNLLGNAANLKSHPIQQLIVLQNHLTKEQNIWLQYYTEPFINRCKTLSNTLLNANWSNIVQKIQSLKTLYPFNPNGEDCPTDLFLHLFSPQGLIQKYESTIEPFIEVSHDGMKIKPMANDLLITNEMLRVIMYSKILQAALNIENNTLHTSIALRPQSIDFPISEINLIMGNTKIPLSPNKLYTLNWRLNDSVAFECILSDGTTHYFSKSGIWSLPRLLDNLLDNGGYKIQDENRNWQTSLEIKAASHLNVTTPNLFKLP